MYTHIPYRTQNGLTKGVGVLPNCRATTGSVFAGKPEKLVKGEAETRRRTDIEGPEGTAGSGRSTC